MAWRVRTKAFLGVVSAIEQLMGNRPLREWAIIECDLDTGVALIVAVTDELDSSHYVTFILEPGERVVLSERGDMPWKGTVLITGKGLGTAGYRGGEVYYERA